MATDNERDMNDFAGGFDDERAAPPGDDKAFEMPDAGGDGGGMNLDAAASTDGAAPAGGADSAAAGADSAAAGGDGNSNASAASTGGNPDTTPIERQPEGGGSGAASADADNGSGGNESGGESGGPEVAIVIGAASPDDAPVDKVDPAAAPGGDVDEPTDPADIQRKKSWEGRLNAREAELKKLADDLEAKGRDAGQQPGAATGDALDAVAAQAESTDPAMADEAGQLAGQVERGEVTPEAAMAQLKEDFGEPFINMIQAIATASAGKALEGMRKDVDALRGDTEEVISHLKSRSDREHFQEIAKAYPDFNEIGKSPEFNQFIESLPPEQKADAERVKNDGSAAEIVALIKEFKDSQAGQGGAGGTDAPAEGGGGGGDVTQAAAAPAAVPPTAGPSEDEIDAASGVRGGGMQLPSEPSGENDFASGWNDTPDVKGGRG